MAVDQSTSTRHLLPLSQAPDYYVTVDGRVFTDRVSTRHRNGGLREVKQSTSAAGYRYIRAVVGGRATALFIHRVMAAMFLPPPAEGQNVVRHLDGNPANNEIANLAWGTQADNMADCIRHGRTLKGIKNPNAKLTAKRVVLVRGLNEEGFSQRAIAAFFGVSPKAVERACNGETWAND